jgi:glycosyltransferase involved in cell wall biosynthesis
MADSVNPLVSVIMIVQNGERFIRHALESIFNQTYNPIEVIIVHGNSQDKTLEILHEYDNLRIIQQTGSGASQAYNTGIKAAVGDFVAFLSYDDLWMPEKLSTQLSYMLQHPNILFTNAHINYFLEDANQIPEGFRKEWLVGTHPARIMETLVARKEVFELVGYLNEDLHTADDVDWYCRASDKKVASAMLPQTLLRKRLHGANNSMQIKKNNQNLLKALKASINRKKLVE